MRQYEISDVARVILSPKAERFFEMVVDSLPPKREREVLDLTDRLCDVVAEAHATQGTVLTCLFMLLLCTIADSMPVNIQVAFFGEMFSKPVQQGE